MVAKHFVLRSCVEAQRRHDFKRWGSDTSYEQRKLTLERTGLLAWLRVDKCSGGLLTVNVFPVEGETDLALWRPWQLHISVAYMGEYSEAEYNALRRALDRRLHRFVFARFTSGGTGELRSDDRVWQVVRPIHARGSYSRRPIHMSF